MQDVSLLQDIELQEVAEKELDQLEEDPEEVQGGLASFPKFGLV